VNAVYARGAIVSEIEVDSRIVWLIYKADWLDLYAKAECAALNAAKTAQIGCAFGVQILPEFCRNWPCSDLCTVLL